MGTTTVKQIEKLRGMIVFMKDQEKQLQVFHTNFLKSIEEIEKIYEEGFEN